MNAIYQENTTLHREEATFASNAVSRQQRITRDRMISKGYEEASCQSGLCGNTNNVNLCHELHFAPPGHLAALQADPVCQADAQAIYARLAHRQYMQECVADHLQLRTLEGAGLAHELLAASQQLQLSLAGKKDIYSPLPNSLGGWSSSWWCGDDTSWSCYFQPFTACTSSYRGGTTCRQDQDVPEDSKFWEKCLCGFCVDKWDVVLPGTEHRGQFWTFSTIVNWMWQPVPTVLELMDTVAGLCGLSQLIEEGFGIIAVHVRGMDACNDNRPCLPFREYLNAAVGLAAEYPNQNLAVFVASDNQTVIDECLRTPPSQLGGMRCLAAAGFNRTLLDPKLYGDRHIEGAERSARNKGLVWDPATFSLMALVEMELLARCHAFVGTFSSTMDVTILGLMMARRHVLPPYHSFEPEGTAGKGMFRWLFG
jgi:hypothetical protein